MNTAVELLVQTTVATSVVLILLLACRRLLARLLGAQAVYLLWLAVPLGLLLLLALAASPAPTALPAFLPRLDVGEVGSVSGAMSGEMQSAKWLGLAWLTGLVTMLLHLARQVRAAKRLAASASAPGDYKTGVGAEYKAGFDDPPMLVCKSIAAPVVVGFVTPLVLLPSDFGARLDAYTRALVLRHEACHARRRDNLVNLFASVLLAIYWFNPLAWIGLRAFRTDQELSCDAHALNTADAAQRARYGHALLDVAASTGIGPVTTSWQLNHSTQRRIMMLNRHHHSNLRMLAGATLVCAFTVVSASIAPNNGSSKSATDQHVDTQPRLLVEIVPNYPKSAAEQGVEGFVTMEFTINEDASVEDIVVLDAHPQTVFEEVAVEALSKWRFVPETVDGVPIPRRAVQTIKFRLDQESSE